MADFTALIAALQARSTDAVFQTAASKTLFDYGGLQDNFTFIPRAKNMLTPTFVRPATSKPRKGHPTFGGQSNLVWDAKALDLYPTKIEEAIDPEEYEERFLTLGLMSGLDISDSSALAKFILDTIIMSEADQIRNFSIWSAVYSQAGTTPLTTFTGFERLIANAEANDYTPVTVPVLDDTNTYDFVIEVMKAVGVKYKNLPDMQVLVSQEVFDFWVAGYQAVHNDREPEYIRKTIAAGSVNGMFNTVERKDNQRVVGAYLAGSNSNIPIKIEPSLTFAGSKKIIATPKSNLQIGSNLSMIDKFLFQVLAAENFVINISGAYRIGAGIYETKQGAIATSIED